MKPKKDNSLHGILVDLDHSVNMKGNLPLENVFLTGTTKFMALERPEFDQRKTIGHTCRHDLESFFYVFIVGCIEHERVSGSTGCYLNK